MPHLSLDVFEEMHFEGARLYLVNVAPALEEIRCDGKLRARVGTRCEEMSGDQARRFLEERRRYDWSAEASGFRLSDARPDALAIARRYYQDEHGRVPGSDSALVSQLGLLAGDPNCAGPPDDPSLNNAGALLLCPFEPGSMQLDVIATRVEGVVSHRRLELKAPSLVAFESAWQFLRESFPATPMVLGPQRREVRAVPERAFREALVNAIAHRDYRQPFSRIVALFIGEPSTTLKVRSPGGFPPGVRSDRLLTTPSRPRNPVLANALHVLGFGESEGIGIDTMYLEMLRDGHVEPNIAEDAGEVLCILSGGQTDQQVRSFFDELGAATPSLRDDVRACIAVTQLLQTATLRPEALARRAQCADLEALEVLESLSRAGVTERLLTGSRSFRLTDSARGRLRRRLAYTPRATLDEHWEMIRAYLDPNVSIGRVEAARLLGVEPVQASRILSELYNSRGVLRPVASPLGRGVRYRLATAQKVNGGSGDGDSGGTD